MAPNLTKWFKGLNFKLGGAAISVMDIPPSWNYQQYLKAYGDVGWLFGANSLISEAVADVKWHLYEKDGSQLGDEVDNHPLLDMWAYVNPFQTKYQFIQLTQMYLGLVGEAFWVLNFNKLGVPAEMWLAPPQYMYIIPSQETYISHYEYRRNFGRLRLEVPEVIHIMSPNPANSYRGLGPAQSISLDLDSERYAARYQQRLFYNDATPGMIIEYPDIPEKSERDKIRMEWDEIHRGWRNARKTGFLWGGAKANTLALTNRDMEFWRLRKINRETIIGAYRLPTSMMGLEGPGSRARVEADEYIFAKYTVKPALTRIKEAINEQLVPLFDAGWQFSFENPVPENRVEIVDEVSKLVPVGIITREEARVKLGYDAQAAKGETYLTPMTLMPEKVKRHESLVNRQFSEEQKEVRWRLYANKADQDELQCKRLFKRLWFEQMDEVAEAWKLVPQLDQAFNEEGAKVTWDTHFNPFIAHVFEEAYDLATTGGALSPVHTGKQEGVLDPQALEWIAYRSLNLAKMVNGTTYEELRAALAIGFEEGESTQQLTRRIREYYQGGYERRATLVARTEVIAASNEGALRGYESEGLNKAEFYAALDERTCDECMAYHGDVRPIDEARGLIPVHPQCRCTWVPVME
uniref:Putative portal protein n=1 Tax=viral metagenome TaxID=1070528 RepID=A0A6H1ZUQ3_9ZZZZ